MREINTAGLLLLLLILPFLWGPFEKSAAQNETGYDLVAAVNALRASYGLEPYTIDYWIMDYAQQHSQYQADTQTSTHTHSDGTNSLSQGLRENVAGGDTGYVTVDIVVNQIWVDWGHLNLMIGYESGQVGGGVANGTNGTTYYTLNVRVWDQVETTLTPNSPIAATAPFLPIITATPLPSGQIWHLVLEGETLWGIAISYGVTMQSIRDLNGMLAEESTIYPGDLLLIRTGTNLTATQEPPTSVPPSPTPEYTSSATSSPMPEPSATSSPTVELAGPIAPEPPANNKTLLIMGIIFGSAGVLLGVATFLVNRKRDQQARERS